MTKVVVTGATGNIGTTLVRQLVEDPAIDEVVGISRRPPLGEPEGWTHVAADVGRDRLERHMQGTDVVVHLAWLIAPSHDHDEMWRANVLGTRRVAEAAAKVGVKRLVHASSLAVYAPGPKEAPGVDERWERTGIPTLAYARQKVAAEELLDEIEGDTDMAVVRLRPALVLKPQAATGVRRLFLGPLFPNPLASPAVATRAVQRLAPPFQVAHTDDVARAFHRAAATNATGAFNIATSDSIGRGRPATVRAARPLAHLAWLVRLVPAEPGWLDCLARCPLLDPSRAREELGWEAQKPGAEVLREFFAGLRRGGSEPTPPLSRSTSGPARVRELTGAEPS